MLIYEYAPGLCIAGFCAFTPTTRRCAGGCFRQLDGGAGCNE
jgi:hypothetical protein